MSEATVLEREQAIARYLGGESATAICRSVGRSREWLYKMAEATSAGRSAVGGGAVASPAAVSARVTSDLEAAIVTTRRSLAER